MVDLNSVTSALKKTPAPSEAISQTSKVVKDGLAHNDVIKNTIASGHAVSKATDVLKDTPPHNHGKTLLEDITEHFPEGVVKGATNVLAKIADTGHKVIENIQKNPMAYIAGTGIAALVAGVAVGRISKPNNDENSKTEILHVKMHLDN